MTARISSPVFVGRGEELQRLQAVLAGARSGVVGTIIWLILGAVAFGLGWHALATLRVRHPAPPDLIAVGKTRLLMELRGGAESAGLRFLGGGCVDLGDGARPYDPLVAALRPWLKALPPEDFSRIVGPARSAVMQLIPDLESGEEGGLATEAPTSARKGRSGTGAT